jgi:hypothetical protein
MLGVEIVVVDAAAGLVDDASWCRVCRCRDGRKVCLREGV